MPNPTVRIRPARPADADTVADLINLIDLHRPADDMPALLDQVRTHVATSFPDGPFSHGANHILIAEDQGQPVGVIKCGPTIWMIEGPEISRYLRPRLVQRVSAVQEMAVSPQARGRGIGRALLQQAEDDMRRAGIRVLLLRHERSLERFYRSLGYISAPRLTLDLPPTGHFVRIDRGWKYAVKTLAPEASITTVHGNPVVIGILTD